MLRALAIRPTQQGVEKAYAQCPVCAAPGDQLRLELAPASRSQPFALAALGIECARWQRNKVQVVCKNCGCGFCGAEQLRWNYAVAMRRFADFGLTKTPLPLSRRVTRNKPSFLDTVRANTAPAKRVLVSERKAAGLMARPTRRARRERLRELSAERMSTFA
jgi:hypothetical protein